MDGVSRQLPAPFLVAATQNPVEYEGTYPLPEAQLDRFLLKVVLPMPERDQELEILRRHAAVSTRATSGPPGSPPWPAPADIEAGRGRGDDGRRSHPRSSATSSTSPAPPASRRR